ncbi:S-layer homology domain-containing protein [Tepidibacter aestuarii]|uniref:S-layer homology domain-containing protein n=1 Tax=Tepidibacter aestuarii TaxID=2925782 RepID=UPI0020BED0CA|nr:S-layer homology domain-containing protein [Tepidibacter aestuarii]CAH2213860.1 conserved exported protein of unknown function [Tepidibacter aestuarii]
MFRISKIRKTLTSIIPSIIILMNFSVVNAQEIADINYSSDYAIESIQNLSQLGIVNGDENGNFNPKKAVTRSEMIKMIVKALDIDTNNVDDNEVFKDVTKESWEFEYVQAAYEAGIVKGISEDEFGKNQKCTREQMAVMFIRALSMNKGSDRLNSIKALDDKDNISDWAKKEVDLAIESGLMNGFNSNTFDPKGDAKREQVAVVIDRFIKSKEELTKRYVNAYKYPEFYDVVERAASTPYNGEIYTDINTYYRYKPIGYEEAFLYSNVKIDQVANNDDYKWILTVTNDTDLEISEEEIKDGTYANIKIGNKIYLKQPDGWKEYEMGKDVDYIDGETKIVDSNFYDNFNKRNIQREEDVYLDGTHTTKYAVEVKKEDIINILSGLEYSTITDTLEDLEYLNYDEVTFRYEYFINDENEIVQMKFTLNPIEVYDEYGSIEIYFDSTSQFKNIGKDIEIKPPNELIK